MDDLPIPSASRSTPVRPGRPHRPAAIISVFVYGWLLTAVSATIFLAAGPVQGSLGIFLVASGLVLTFVPPRVHVGWPLWAAVGGLLFCGSLSFLPAHWFTLPGWRTALTAEPAIHLPATITPVPWETGFWLGILGASCLIGLYLLGHPLRSKSVLGLAAAAVAVCGVYAALSIYAKQTGWHYPFAGGATFGFFPNRNHTATFLVTGSITALGVLTVYLREERWSLAVLVGAGLAVCVAGLFFFSGSRGGVIFLMIGTLLWTAGLGGTHRNVPLLVSLVALTVAGGVLFFVSGGEARARLLGADHAKASTEPVDPAKQHPSTDALPANDRDTPLDFRVLIYRDTFAMIKDAPVAGTGLGAFAPVFAQYRRASLSPAAAIHPESDWLMLIAEAGVPALVCALVIGALLALRLRGASDHPFWPLRWGCAAAAATAVLHGVVDVPGHRVALGWWILLLAALGIPSGGSTPGRSPLLQRALCVLGGLSVLGLGVQLIRAEWFGGQALPPFAAAKARGEIQKMFEHQDTEGALNLAREAVGEFPTDATIRHEYGVLLLHFEDTDAEVDRVFEAERRLNPVWPEVPLQQGDAWITVDPHRAASLWEDALDRQVRISRAMGESSDGANYYRMLVERARPWPAVQRELERMAARDPGFALTWLDGASPEVAHEPLDALTNDTALLAKFTPEQRRRWLASWYAKGDRPALFRFLDAHQDWQAEAWPVQLHALIDAAQFEQAVHEAAQHYGVRLDLAASPSPGASSSPTPGQTDDAVGAFHRYWDAGNGVAARNVLHGATTTPDSAASIDAEVWRLATVVAAQDGAWQQAWLDLKHYLQQTHPAETLP